MSEYIKGILWRARLVQISLEGHINWCVKELKDGSRANPAINAKDIIEQLCEIINENNNSKEVKDGEG